MKRTLFISVLTFIGLMSACSNESLQSQDGVSDYPDEVKTTIDDVPEDFKDDMVVPAKLPESYKAVDFSYASEPPEDPEGRIVTSAFKYTDDESVLMFQTMYGNVTVDNVNTDDTVTLEDGTEARATDSRLMWEGDGKTNHELSFMEPPEGEAENELTQDDLIEIANSMQPISD